VVDAHLRPTGLDGSALIQHADSLSSLPQSAVPVAVGRSASTTRWLLPSARQSSLDVDMRIVTADRGQAGRNPRVV